MAKPEDTMTFRSPIKDPPPDGMWALVYMGNAPYGGVDCYRSGMFIDGDFLSAANAYEMRGVTPRGWITGWMPLPKPMMGEV